MGAGAYLSQLPLGLRRGTSGTSHKSTARDKSVVKNECPFEKKNPTLTPKTLYNHLCVEGGGSDTASIANSNL